LCEDRDTLVFFERASIPLSANVLYHTRDAALQAARGRLSLSACRSCGFVFNAAFDPTLMIYGSGYDNDQTFSREFIAHMRTAANQVGRSMPEPLRVLEIGCGQGQFLDMLLEERPESVGIGFDPSLRRSSTDRLRFVAKYLNADGLIQAAFEPNVVVSRHVIEHVQHPIEFLGVIRQVIPSDTLLFLETPCVTHILDAVAFWDFCYEHCSYFSPETLRAACERVGFEVRRNDHVFAGQYLWLEGRSARARAVSPAIPHWASIERFRARVETVLSHWRSIIEQANLEGRVAIWGGGTKGAGFAQLVDPGATQIHGIIDINPRKHGRYLAGTGHRIIEWREAVADGVATVVVMNPNYLGEIRATIAAAGVSLTLLAAESNSNATA
jgi:SAM-dependent methyltransferase